MLQPADLLLLDEPTNDLDIPTLEILEESLLEYPGALVLVTHDRYLLDRVSTVVLGLDGKGSAEGFADYSQWDAWQRESGQEEKKTGEKTAVASPEMAKAAKKLSYMDARDYATIEHRVADAEVVLQTKRDALEDPAIVSDAPKLLQAHAELDAAQDVVDTLYARWAELEGKLK